MFGNPEVICFYLLLPAGGPALVWFLLLDITVGAGCPILALFARVGFHGGQFLGF